MKKLRELACIVITFWQDLLDSFNSDGGHIALLFVLVWLCGYAMKQHVDKADIFLAEAVGALLLILKAAGSNKTRRDRPAPPDPPAPPASTDTPDKPGANG